MFVIAGYIVLGVFLAPFYIMYYGGMALYWVLMFIVGGGYIFFRNLIRWSFYTGRYRTLEKKENPEKYGLKIEEYRQKAKESWCLAQ